jgi:hypothetical protein
MNLSKVERPMSKVSKDDQTLDFGLWIEKENEPESPQTCIASARRW